MKSLLSEPVSPGQRVTFRNVTSDALAQLLDYGDFGTVRVDLLIGGLLVLEAGTHFPLISLVDRDDPELPENVIPIHKKNSRSGR